MPKYNPTTSGNPYVTAFHDLMATSKDFTQFLADPAERQGIRQGFMDAVNRGAVAATLGAPVDMANTALNLGKAGVGYIGNKTGLLSADQMPQLIDNPVGGSEYIGNQMRRLGVVSPNRNALAEGLAGFLPMSPSTSGKAVAAIGAGGMVPGLDLAATVFHGSPHKFDRFDSSKIGTGEGAQAYGHGLYLAESPDVANTYKLAGVDAVKLVGRDGGAINLSALPQPLQKALNANAGAPDLLGNAQRFLANKFNQDYYSEKYGAPSIDDAVKALQNLRASGVSVENPGSLYKVDLPDEAIAKMLDWDKPLSQQPNVVKALQQEYAPSYISQFMDRPGSDLYKAISGGSGVEDLRASGAAELAKQGIPGIRYLDAGSRSAGSGSSNYVVFPGEENMLRILERNGQPLGTKSGGGGAQMLTPANALVSESVPSKIINKFLDNSEYKNSKYIQPPHEVRDTKKLQELTESMQKNGWQGRPILAYDIGRGTEALTGSHRIAAAKAAGIKEIPVMYVDADVANYLDKNGKSILDASFLSEEKLHKWLLNFGDEDAANLIKFEQKNKK